MSPLFLLPLLPALGALLLIAPRHAPPTRSRNIATVTAGLTLCLSLGVPHHLALDGSSTLALPFLGLLTLATMLAAPRQALGRGALVTLLLTQSAALGFFCASNLFTALLLFIAMTTLPDLHLSREDPSTGGPRPRGVVRVYLLIAGVPLGAATLLLGLLGWHPTLCALLLLGTCTRMAMLPLHTWLPVWMTRSPSGSSTLWMSLIASLHLLNRWLLPLLPPEWATTTALPVLASLGAGTALYGALLAFIQRDLRRMLAFAVMSQSGLMLAGVASADPEGIHGAWLHCLAAGIAFTGLDLLVRALEARTGTTDLGHLGGLSARAPRMATLFFLLCLAAMGLPGTLAFVSEDLLLRGTLGAHPWHTLLLPPALALNAFTLLRACHRAFLGPARASPMSAQDLLPRERWMATALVLAVIVGGLAPPGLQRSLASTEARLASVLLPQALASTPGAGARGLSGIARKRAYPERESPRHRREPHVPDERTKCPERSSRGDPAVRLERL